MCVPILGGNISKPQRELLVKLETAPSPQWVNEILQYIVTSYGKLGFKSFQLPHLRQEPYLSIDYMRRESFRLLH